MIQDTYINESDGLRYCSACRTPRQYKITVLGAERIVPVMCECQAEAEIAKQNELELKEKIEKISRMKQSCLQDACLQDYRFENDNGSNPKIYIAQQFVDRWAEVKQNAMGLLLFGDVGTGKSFMAGCIANALIEKGIPALMTSIQTILKGMGPASAFKIDLNEYLANLNRYSLLIIDDLGTERRTEYVNEQMFSIINSRYTAKKPMIITTNMTPTQMKEVEDLAQRRIYDRILECCTPVCINETNHRQINAANQMEQLKKMVSRKTDR